MHVLCWKIRENRAVAKSNLNSEACQVLRYLPSRYKVLWDFRVISSIIFFLSLQCIFCLMLNAYFGSENTLNLSLYFQLNSTAALLKDINLNGQKVKTHILKAYFLKKNTVIYVQKRHCNFKTTNGIFFA